jgi:hypothetical protein
MQQQQQQQLLLLLVVLLQGAAPVHAGEGGLLQVTLAASHAALALLNVTNPLPLGRPSLLYVMKASVTPSQSLKCSFRSSVMVLQARFETSSTFSCLRSCLPRFVPLPFCCCPGAAADSTLLLPLPLLLVSGSIALCLCCRWLLSAGPEPDVFFWSDPLL